MIVSECYRDTCDIDGICGIKVTLSTTIGIIMSKFEYKTIELKFRSGFFRQGLPDIESALNREGKDGWQLKQIILPSSAMGTSDSVVAILERAVE